MTYKCKVFEAVNVSLHGYYTLVYIFQSYWYKYRKQNMSDKQVIHDFLLLIKNKYGWQIHSIDTYYC